MKLWAGRFSKEVDATVNDFNSSISFDSRMAREDIMGSIAHAAMLGETGIIDKGESQRLCDGLAQLLHDLEAGTLAIDPAAEDIHTFIEAELTARLGDAGKRLHTARSRNDQVALDLRLHLKHEITTLKDLLVQLIDAVLLQASQHTETVMCGYTHLQRAQPITLAHHLMAYVQMLLRDLDRLDHAYAQCDVMPLGSGALAGTTYPLDRELVAQTLGFSQVSRNSLDGVSDRDFCIELASALSIMMMHLSRFSEEIILWCSWEFKYIELDDAYATGSSIMPQKKNPDVAELVRGKTGRVYGDLMTLLSMMKSLPLAYNKDMQEDKEAIFDAVDTAKLCLKTFAPMIATMRVLPDNMRAAAAKGFINATDCADYLTKKGMPFRDAYKVVGSLVAYCIANDHTLEGLSLNEYRSVSELFGDDIYDAVSLLTCVRGRNVIGGPAPEQVKAEIARANKTLNAYRTTKG